MQGRKITKEEFDKVKTLLARGFSANEIYQNKFVDLCMASIYRIQRMDSYKEEVQKKVNVKDSRYEDLIDELFYCAVIDERNPNELFFPNVRVRELLKEIENERYNEKLYDLN